jgi:hypothetical protein
MWDPQHLTTLQASYGDSFYFFLTITKADVSDIKGKLFSSQRRELLTFYGTQNVPEKDPY